MHNKKRSKHDAVRSFLVLKVKCVLFSDKVISSVLGPRLFIMARSKRLFLTIAYRIQTSGSSTEVNEIILGTVGATLAKSQVIFIGASFITMSFNDNFSRSIFL